MELYGCIIEMLKLFTHVVSFGVEIILYFVKREGSIEGSIEGV